MYRDPKSDMPVTQFNMKWVEQAGLVKFDFLGLKTLTVLQTAVRLLKQRGIELDLAAIPLDDKKTYDLLSRAEAVGIFQLESQGMRRALLDMRPDRFEDIIALVALYRPGPMANIPTYCARKHGTEKPEYIHPKLEPILRETYGVIVYQEQVMQAAQILAGYTLGQADLLRRAMGKKIRKEMQAQRKHFVKGATERGIERAHADAIFDLLERFAEYGFNKSHAAAYALVAYQTAYHEGELSGGVHGGVDDARHGQHRQAVGIPRRGRAARHQGRAAVGQSLGRGVRGRRQHDLLRARRAQRRRPAGGGHHRRGARRKAVRRSDRLRPPHQSARGQQAGAGKPRRLRRLRHARAEPGAGARRGRRHACRPRNARMRPSRSGRTTCSAACRTARPSRSPRSSPGSPADKLQREYDAIGFFLSGHPLDEYASLLQKLKVQSWTEFSRSVKSGASAGRVAATVVSRTERRTKTGNKMGIFGLSDPSGHYEAIVFAEGLQLYRDILEPGAPVLLFLSAEAQGDEIRARIQSAEPLDQAASKLQKGLRVFLRDQAPLEPVAKRLDGKGDGEVSMVLQLGGGAEVEVKLPGRFKVSPQIAGAIKAVPGVLDVQLDLAHAHAVRAG